MSLLTTLILQSLPGESETETGVKITTNYPHQKGQHNIEMCVKLALIEVIHTVPCSSQENHLRIYIFGSNSE